MIVHRGRGFRVHLRDYVADGVVSSTVEMFTDRCEVNLSIFYSERHAQKIESALGQLPCDPDLVAPDTVTLDSVFGAVAARVEEEGGCCRLRVETSDGREFTFVLFWGRS